MSSVREIWARTLRQILFSLPPALCAYIDVHRCVGELKETDWLSELPAFVEVVIVDFCKPQISDRIKLLIGNYTGEYILLLVI